MSLDGGARFTIGPRLAHPVAVGGGNLFAFCGPCVIESRESALRHAEAIQKICHRIAFPLVYKSSFDKANRTSGATFRGLGRDEGLQVLSDVREQFGVPVITDVHSEADARAAGDVVDVLQIPAFLCRQTDLLIAAGQTGKPVQIKKGQFLHPEGMALAADKIASTGNRQVLLCERGTTFGYGDLVVDFRSLEIMAHSGFPVVFDATHSVQRPGAGGDKTIGDRQFVAGLARAAVAVGVDGVFLESHENPSSSPSDGANMIPLDALEDLLTDLQAIHTLALRTRRPAGTATVGSR
ncbi:MAG: 3-deoxy-8-phosphooctulonate synthase [Deltaproteobacteria bacterium]|nr:3-deoxy-8-phosphooctulonate synthase [Deltaproteobacteria bacterium]